MNLRHLGTIAWIVASILMVVGILGDQLHLLSWETSRRFLAAAVLLVLIAFWVDRLGSRPRKR